MVGDRSFDVVAARDRRHLGIGSAEELPEAAAVLLGG
jgi:hypothetical protein